MAGTRPRVDGRFITAVLTSPAAPASGDPCILGGTVGVAQAPKDAVTGATTIDRRGVYLLAVTNATAVGDVIWATPGAPVTLTSAAPGAAAPGGATNRFGVARTASGGAGNIEVIVGA